MLFAGWSDEDYLRNGAGSLRWSVYGWVGVRLQLVHTYRNKIGLDVALEALKDARAKKKASADDLWRFAKICRVTNVMRPYLEAVE